MDFIALSAVLLLTILIAYVFARPSFDRESVLMRFNETVAVVDGDFFVSSVIPLLFVSFPRTPEMNGFEVFDGGNRMPYVVLGDYVFLLVFNPLTQQKTVSVRYYEDFAGRSEFTYIVSTARSWGKPLQKAEFSVEFPREWSLVDSAYKVKSLEEQVGVKKAFFVEVPFWPSEEFWFEFRR